MIEERVLNLHGANVASHPENRNKPNKTWPSGRICADKICRTVLSIYNGEEWCWEHRPEANRGIDPRLSRARQLAHQRRYDKLDVDDYVLLLRHGKREEA